LRDLSLNMDPNEEIEKLESEMASPIFWENKVLAQEKIKELNNLKAKLSNLAKYDKGNAIITIFSGAGGDDAEDWSRMLYVMYSKFSENKGHFLSLIHENRNDHGGFRNITFEIRGKNAYGTLKNESGVHRLVRISPFSSKKLRHTSFSMVEVIPKFDKEDKHIPSEEIKVEFSKSGGPGGQNVNKRETAVRVIHIPTGLTAHSESGRSQVQNREKAIEMLEGKLYKMKSASEKKEQGKFYVSKTTDIEWGNQIRSYILHPYKLVKDHRTNIEHKEPKKVLEEGDLDLFIEAEKGI
jgi:peptide chain release factor 2